MAWQKGQSGNPHGRSKDKLVAEALRVELNSLAADGNRKKLRALAESMVDAAIGGNVEAAKFVADRIDGKAHATVDMKHDVTESFLRLLEHVDSGLAKGMAGEQGQPPAIRH